jgi:cation:H+ antiporter
MILIYAILAIILSAGLLYIAGELIVAALVRLSRYFKVTEFVMAFFVMALAGSLPNLFVGVTSALQGIPELSFGDIMGNNIIALTLAVAFGVLFAPRHELPLENQTIQDTTFLTSIAAILPLIFISDGTISRSDGLVLLLFFFGYMYWMFSKRDRFTKVFEDEDQYKLSRQQLMIEIGRLVGGVVLLALAAQGIVYGAELLAAGLGLSLLLVGILVIGLGGALPEIYFTVISARRGAEGMIVGNLMGSVIIPATLVLGIVAIIKPISNTALEFSTTARIFLILVALFFLYVSQTKHMITVREATILMVSYVLFVLSLIYIS